jgi:DNA-binding ferritin-like protein
VCRELDSLQDDIFSLYIWTRELRFNMSAKARLACQYVLEEHARELLTTVDAIDFSISKIDPKATRRNGTSTRKQAFPRQRSQLGWCQQMLNTLSEANSNFVSRFRNVLHVCKTNEDHETALLLEALILKAEQRIVVLQLTSRQLVDQF